MQISISSTKTSETANRFAKSKIWHLTLSFLHSFFPLIPPSPPLGHIYRVALLPCYTESARLRVTKKGYWPEWPILQRYMQKEKMIVRHICLSPTWFMHNCIVKRSRWLSQSNSDWKLAKQRNLSYRKKLLKGKAALNARKVRSEICFLSF